MARGILCSLRSPSNWSLVYCYGKCNNNFPQFDGTFCFFIHVLDLLRACGGVGGSGVTMSPATVWKKVIFQSVNNHNNNNHFFFMRIKMKNSSKVVPFSSVLTMGLCTHRLGVEQFIMEYYFGWYLFAGDDGKNAIYLLSRNSFFDNQTKILFMATRN